MMNHMNKKLLIAFSFWLLSFTFPSSSLHAYILDSFTVPECCGSLAWDNGTMWCSTTTQMYNMDTLGNVITSFNLPYDNEYGWPFAYDGHFYWVVDNRNDKVLKLDSLGNTVYSFEYPHFSWSSGLTWDGQYLWIVNYDSHTIDKYDTTGQLMTSINTPGHHERGITFDGEYLWVGDYPNIFKMDLSGMVEFILYYPEGSQQGLTYDGKYLWTDVCTDNESRINKLEPDRQTGTYEHFRWAFHTEWTVSCPAIGSDGTIYVGSDYGSLYAINSDGTEKWAFKTGSQVPNSPVIGQDGTIYIQSEDNYLYALSPDGELKWSFYNPSRYAGEIFLAAGGDGMIYATSSGFKLYALNPDGTVKWELDTVNKMFTGLSIGADGTLYGVTANGTVSAFDPSGFIKWTVWTDGPLEFSPAISTDGTIYVVSSPRSEGFLYAISPCGWIKWRFKLTLYAYSSPVIGENGTIYANSGGILFAVNPDGTEKWSVNVGGVTSIPALGKDGTIFAAINIRLEKNLTAISPEGIIKWSFHTGGTMLSSPAIGPDGTLYVGSEDGNLYAINTDSGGLAESSWPMYQQNPLHTSRAEQGPIPACSLCPAETLLGDDNEKLNSLRALRDNVLAKSAFGKKFIETYYSNADRVNSFLGNHPVIRESAKKALDLAVPVMNKIVR